MVFAVCASFHEFFVGLSKEKETNPVPVDFPDAAGQRLRVSRVQGFQGLGVCV